MSEPIPGEIKAFIAAVQKIDELLCIEDQVYTVRDEEHEGWDGPKVCAFDEASQTIKKFLEKHHV